jgi:hypothetical protein
LELELELELVLMSRRAIRPRRTMLSSIVSMLLTTVSGREEERDGKNQRRLCVYVSIAPLVGLKRHVWKEFRLG